MVQHSSTMEELTQVKQALDATQAEVQGIKEAEASAQQELATAKVKKRTQSKSSLI